MSTTIIGFFKNQDSYYEAIWQKIRHWKDAKRAIGIRFAKYEVPVWHRGHIVYHETRFRAVVTFETHDGRIVSRQCSAQDWPIYAISPQEKTWEVKALQGSKSTKAEKTYTTSLSECNCPAYRHNSGLIKGFCKHQLMLMPELLEKPYLKQGIYSYPWKKPTLLKTGYSPAPGFHLQQESSDYGYDFQVILTYVSCGRQIQKVIGYLCPTEGGFQYYNRHRQSKTRELTPENLKAACLRLHEFSDYKYEKIWSPQLVKDDEEVDIDQLASASLNFSLVKPRPKEPPKTYRLRVIKKEKSETYLIFNLDTRKYLDCGGLTKKEAGKKAYQLAQEGHKIDAIFGDQYWILFENKWVDPKEAKASLGV